MYVPPWHFIRHCRHHSLKFSSWTSWIKIRATRKQLFRTSYLIGFLFQWFESALERKKTWLKRQLRFFGKKNSKNAVFVGSRFLALGGRSIDKIFSNVKSIHLYTWKRLKQFWRRKFVSLFSFQFVWFWLPFYFNLFLFHYLLVRPGWGSDKSTRKSGIFLSFQG